MGVEPTTCRLRIGCSTTELPRPCFHDSIRGKTLSIAATALCESCALSEKLHALEELLETRVGVQGDEPRIDFEKDHEVGVLAFGFGETAESGLVVSQRDLHEAGRSLGERRN